MYYFARMISLGLVIASVMPFEVLAKSVIGWIEPVSVNGEMYLEAKIDTGADHSSLHAEQVEEFLRDNQLWVRFRLQDQAGKLHILERPVVRHARIKRKDINLKSQKRPVVEFEICIGKHKKKVDVNLAGRKKYKYKLLIGRSFLRGSFWIDAEKQRLTEPQCDNGKKDN